LRQQQEELLRQQQELKQHNVSNNEYTDEINHLQYSLTNERKVNYELMNYIFNLKQRMYELANVVNVLREKCDTYEQSNTE
jgi:hypothetical protein